MRIVAADTEGLQAAVAALRRGAIVAYPTETVYGLAVDPFSEIALHRLFAAKGRQETNPVLLAISDRAQLDALTMAVSPAAEQCINKFWPGPLSLLFPAVDGLSRLLTGGADKVCARHSAHPLAQALCEAFGGAITSTSANRSGEMPARNVHELSVPGVAIAIDGGPLEVSAPSTIYDPDTGRVIRKGAIPEDALPRA